MNTLMDLNNNNSTTYKNSGIIAVPSQTTEGKDSFELDLKYKH